MPQSSSPVSTPHRDSSADTHSSPRTDDGSLMDKLAKYKRLYTTLQEQVNNETPNKKKKQSSTTQLGRGIRRLVTLYEDLAELIAQSDRHQLSMEDEEEDDTELDGLDDDAIVEVKRSRERSYFGFKQLVRLIPNIQKKLDDGEPGELQEFYTSLQNGANDARSDDVMKMKTAVANWVNVMSPQANPLLDPRTRTSRGLQHDITGRLLCPIDFDWDDPEVRAKERGDINDVEKGFLKSALLVNAYKYIFTSPSSTADPVVAEGSGDENQPPRQRATSSKKSRRKDVAVGLHMNEQVTPRSIAYAAVQLLFALSDATQWVQVHQGFDYRVFYYFIIDYFEDTSGPVAQKKAQELLKWWNMHVFPNSSTPARQRVSTSMKKLAEQRAANEHRR